MPETVAPIALAIEDLTTNERLLVQSALLGRTLDLRGAVDDANSEVRAAVVAQLLVSPATLLPKAPIAVRLRGAVITGQLNLGGHILGCSLELVDCILDKPIVLTKATASNVNLRGSRVYGLHANFARIAGTLNLSGGFHCTGQAKLSGAQLGQLEAEGAVFYNPRGLSVRADYLVVDGFATFERSDLFGTLRMLGARINGQLDCSSAQIIAPAGKDAVELDSARIVGGVFFNEARVVGGVWLVGLQAEGEVTFTGASVENAGAIAIDASSTRLRNVDLSGAQIEGEVKIAAAELSSLDCFDSEFRAPADASLDLDSTTISGAFHAHFATIEGRLDLTNTTMGVYRDAQASWPPEARLIGASYNKLEGDEDSLASDTGKLVDRLGWLKLDARYHPQKYAALAAAYSNVGHEAFGRRVLIAGEHQRRLARTSGLIKALAWSWSMLIRILVGYGYAPARAIWSLLVLVALGSVAAWWGHSLGAIALIPGKQVEFNPLRYSVDLLFPVAGLPDSDAFFTYGLASWLAFGLAIAGWFLAAVVVAALAGLLRRT